MTYVLGTPIFQSWKTNNEFNNGGFVHTYEAGSSSTLKATYPTVDDAIAGTNANANPVELDAYGTAAIVLKGATKVVITDAAGDIIPGHTFDDLDSATTNITDANGNELLKFSTVASAVNELTITNAAAGNEPRLSATGDDTDIDVDIRGKGTGGIKVNGVYRLPIVDGAVHQVIETDAAGVASWADSGRLAAVQTFTASATMTTTAGARSIIFYATGGGGAGGAGGSGAGGGAGGGAGATCIHRVTSPAATYALTVGTGGAGGAGAGAVGLDTTVAALCTAGGGLGGTSNAVTTGVAGVAGGTATGANIANIPGGGSGAGIFVSNVITVSGQGGASRWGGGAPGVVNNTAGATAAAYGAGGSGGAPTSGTAKNGGSGKDGIVIAYEYY